MSTSSISTTSPEISISSKLLETLLTSGPQPQNTFKDSSKRVAEELIKTATRSLQSALQSFVPSETATSASNNQRNKLDELKQAIDGLEALLPVDEQLSAINEALKIHANHFPNIDPSDSTQVPTSVAMALGQRILKQFAQAEALSIRKTGSEQQHTHAHHDHDHEHGNGVVIDLDEAVHGFYAASKYLISILQGNPSHVAAEFETDARELASNTLQHLGEELIPNGLGEVIASVGVSSIMLPLAFLAMKAGWEEMHHASHEMKDVQKHMHTLNKIRDNLDTIRSGMNSTFIEKEQKLNSSQTNVIQRALKHAKLDRMIGFSSFASGLSIGSKALSDIGLKIGLGLQGALTGKGFLGMSSVTQASTTAGVATTVLGSVSTFALGPLAGLFATTLGVYFTRKSTSKLKQLKTDFGLTKAELSQATPATDPDSSTAKTPFDTYKTFIENQGKRRTQFFKNFSRWNKAFMIGSGLYAASATTKAIVAGLAIGGMAAAASNPIGLGVITAVGTIGALGMGIASYCFITGHGQQGKYTSHTAAEDALIDRKLIVQSQLHSESSSDHDSSIGQQRFNLASASLKRLNDRKDAIRSFLSNAATGMHKISALETTENGVKTSKSKNESTAFTEKLTLWKRLKGQALRTKDVKNYLFTNNQYGTAIDFAKKDLSSEAELLTVQIKELQTLMTSAVNSELKKDVQLPHGKKEVLDVFNAYTQEQLVEKKHQLEHRLHRTVSLQDQLESHSDDETVTALLKHWGATVPEKANKQQKNQLFAEYLFKQVDKQVRNARGVLFEGQLQASKAVSQQTKIEENQNSR